jgi:hypothetical protein
MDRRACIGTFGLLAAALAAGAQQAKVWRIGLLVPGLPPGCGSDPPPPPLLALRTGLRELGYVEMSNYVFVPRRRDETNERSLLTSRFREGSTIAQGGAISVPPETHPAIATERDRA